MKIQIEGTTKEIADLTRSLQGQQENYFGMRLMQKWYYLLGFHLCA